MTHFVNSTQLSRIYMTFPGYGVQHLNENDPLFTLVFDGVDSLMDDAENEGSSL